MSSRLNTFLTRPDAGLAARNMSWILLDRSARLATGLIVTVAIARHLGPAEFGLLSFALVLTALGNSVAGIGLEDVVLRDLSRGRAQDVVLGAGMQLRLFGGGIAYVGVLGFATVFTSGERSSLLVVAVCAVSLWGVPLDLLEIWFQAYKNLRPAVVVKQLVVWVSALTRIFLVVVDAPVEAFAFTFAGEALLIGAGLGMAFTRAGGAVRWRSIDAQTRAHLLHDGFPLMLSGVLVLLAMQLDRLLIAHFHGDAALGIYSAAVRCSEMFYVIPVALGAVVVPRLTALRDQDSQHYWIRSRQVFWLAGGLGAFVAATISVVAAWLLPLLFGARYDAAAGLLAVHIWSLPCVFLVSLRSRLLVIEAGAHSVLLMSVITCTTSAAMNTWLIPRGGALAAAWTSVTAWAIAAFVAPWFVGPARMLMLRLCRLSPAETRTS